MMNDKFTGIVLNQTDYRDNDIIIKVLFRELGILSLIVRGAKKAKSKNISGCLQFSKSEFLFDYRENRTIFNLRTATLIRSYMKDDLVGISLQSVFTEIIDRGYDIGNHAEYYDLLEFCLERLDENRYLLASLYISGILKLQGLSPCVDSCVGCGRKQVTGISYALGGFICNECSGECLKPGTEMLKKFRLINKAGPENYEQIREIEYDAGDFKLIADFFIYQTNMKINAYDLIYNII